MIASANLLKSYRFREEREADWHKLEVLLTRAENRGVKALSDEDMTALPRLYRQAVSSLSVARSISLDQNVIAYLESLCTRAYFFVYGTRATMSERIANFFRYDWPKAVRSSGGATMLAFICLFGGAALGFFLCMQDMEWFWTFHGGMEDRNPNATTDYLRSTLYTDSGENSQGALGGFAGMLFNHNAQIALFAFALGFMFGAPTAILLLYNGITIGSFYALFWSRGLGYELTGWLFIHGVTELFAIVLAGAAGVCDRSRCSLSGTQIAHGVCARCWQARRDDCDGLRRDAVHCRAAGRVRPPDDQFLMSFAMRLPGPLCFCGWVIFTSPARRRFDE